MAVRKRRWSKLSLRARFGLLVAAALALALAAEVCCNLPALATAGLTPVSLPLGSFTLETDVAVTRDSAGVHIQNAENRTVDLICVEINRPLSTVTVALGGTGVANVALLVADQAAAWSPTQIYSAYCVAGDPTLRFLRAAVTSAGDVGELRVRVKPADGNPLRVEAVILNAPIPFVWQPERIALTFTGALLLLCALCLRGWAAAYDPARRAHRCIVALPLAALMAFAILLGYWIAPETPFLSDLTDEEAAQSQTDLYAVLYETLRSGRLSVDKTPSPALLALENPYDATERTAKNVRFPFDYAYANGQFYIYYGPAPVLAVYAPYHTLTGRVPNARDAALLMALLAIPLIGWAVCGLARRYARGANVFALSLCCVTAVFASGALLLLASADFYYLAELSFVCFAAGAVGFGLHAADGGAPAGRGRPRGLAAAQYAASGVCFALAAMSRPSGLPMLCLMLAPPFLGALRWEHAGVRKAAAFLIPAVLGVGALLLYNAARFGSALDFGVAEQLTVTDVHWRTLSLGDLPGALYHYLLEPYTLNSRFPYLSPGYHALPTAGHYVFTLASAGVLASPVLWLTALLPLSEPRGQLACRTLRRERACTLGLPLAASLPLMLLAYGLAGAILRYTFDFRLFYALAAITVALPVFSGGVTRERRAFVVLCAALCLLSVAEGFLLLFDNERNYILKNSPAVYYGFQRMFFPY